MVSPYIPIKYYSIKVQSMILSNNIYIQNKKYKYKSSQTELFYMGLSPIQIFNSKNVKAQYGSIHVQSIVPNLPIPTVSW